MDNPLITVGIPTYNRAKDLVRALDSVLGQTYKNFEVVVSDNASTDETRQRLEAISDSRLRWVRQARNIGMIGNFNACLQEARGELLLLLSDDDLMDHDCLERLSKPFLSDGSGDVSISWCPVKVIDSFGSLKYITKPGPPSESGVDLIECLFRGSRGPRLCSILVRRADAIEAGAYQERYGAICDVGNWSKIAMKRNTAACDSSPLCSYTIHSASVTRQSSGAAWQRYGQNLTDDLASMLERLGRSQDAVRIRAAGNDHISNLLATIMLQYIGKPGWLRYWLSEAVRAPRHVFAPIVFKRLLKDGWKLTRLY